MNKNNRIVGIVGFCVIGLMTGCAGTTPSVEDKADGDSLRNTNLDVLFATEFPVTSEAEALVNAATAMNSGEVDKALFFYVRALQINPQNVDLLVRIGEIHLQRGNFLMAKRALVRANQIDPEHAHAAEALGLVYMVEGQEAAAVAKLRQAVAKDDTLWRAHNALGVYLDKIGEFDAAQAHYDSALERNPAAGQVLNNRGYSKFLAGDYSGATIDLYAAANERGFLRAWGNLGVVYASQGLYDNAVSAFGEIMTEAHAHNSTGQVALENGDLAEASYLLDEAVRRSPTYFPEAEKNLELLRSLY